LNPWHTLCENCEIITGGQGSSQEFFKREPTADHKGGGAHAGFMGGPSVPEVPKIRTFYSKCKVSIHFYNTACILRLTAVHNAINWQCKVGMLRATHYHLKLPGGTGARGDKWGALQLRGCMQPQAAVAKMNSELGWSGK